MGLKIHEKQAIADELLGSCLTSESLSEKYGLDIFDGGLKIGMAAEEYGVWLCECCGWWVEEGELASEADGDVVCQDCYDNENSGYK